MRSVKSTSHWRRKMTGSCLLVLERQQDNANGIRETKAVQLCGSCCDSDCEEEKDER